MSVGVLGLASISCSTSVAPKGRPGVAEQGARERPNIVFVLTDDLAWNLVGYMPNLKRMQREGTTFTNYFVTDSLCCPSRSTTFTGNYPHNTGVFTNAGQDGGYGAFNAHGNQDKTFAIALQRAGYRTALMGKYLNLYHPQDPVPPGWNEWDVAGNGYPEFDYALNENGRVVRYGHRPRDYLTDVLGHKGVDFVNRSAKDNKPFMLEIATFAPHAPYTPAPRDAQKFPDLEAPRGPAFNEADISDKPAWLKNHAKLTAQQISKIDTGFRKRAQAVQAVDKMIGDLQAALQASGSARDTYFVFSSDNGFHLGEHRLAQGKMTAFDTDIKVPLVVTGPGVPAGRRIGRLAQNTDLCPTFEDLAGAQAPAPVDGRSLVPALKGGALPARDAVLIEHHGPNLDPSDPDHQGKNSGNPPSYEAVRTRDAVYVEYADGEREYYDIGHDPYELTNTVGRLPAAERHRLSAILHTLQTCKGNTCH
ncbi:MAG TPA: sulfatase [Streptosporangiaceae bacterium]